MFHDLELKYIIAAGAGGGVLLILLVITTVVICRRRRRAQAGRPSKKSLGHGADHVAGDEEEQGLRTPMNHNPATSTDHTNSPPKLKKTGSAMDEIANTDPLNRKNVSNPLFGRSEVPGSTGDRSPTPSPKPETFGNPDENGYVNPLVCYLVSLYDEAGWPAKQAEIRRLEAHSDGSDSVACVATVRASQRAPENECWGYWNFRKGNKKAKFQRLCWWRGKLSG